MTRIALALAGLALAVPAARAADWDVDPAHSQAQFSVRHMMISNVTGEFGKVTGTVHQDEKDASKDTVEATIDAASVDTRVPDRDKHLRSADFFDVEKFPNITFKSTKVKAKGKDKVEVDGELTIRGVAKPVKLEAKLTPEVKDPWGAMRRAVTATTRVNRKDFGLTWNKALDNGGVLVGDEVTINLSVELVKKAEPKKEAAAAPAEKK